MAFNHRLSLLVVVAATVLLSTALAAVNAELPTKPKTSWTYTYIKALDGRNDDLRKFVESNWFEMDRKAVDRGIFRSYKLIENTSAENLVALDWDFLVAVEYFGEETYEDIASEFEEIRSAHKTVLIDGRGFRELGQVVKSETLMDLHGKPISSTCDLERFTSIKPYFGTWEEINSADDSGAPFGILEFYADPEGCSFRKRFNLFESDFSYVSHGVYDAMRNDWTEQFSFSNGSNVIFDWRSETGQITAVRQTASVDLETPLRRNVWTTPSVDKFLILEQLSSDKGKTWETRSTTVMRRR